ncbi:hypothetical protein, partial [Novipirellula maiorica]|uniref:hypothetical protein n=1 Tax=Novipirellula maiorica TaxID=1265734 RepID=UPI001181BD6B
MPQQTFEFMETAAASEGGNAVLTSSKRRSGNPAKLSGNTTKRPAATIGTSSLLFPLEPYVRSASKRPNPLSLHNHLAVGQCVPAPVPTEPPPQTPALQNDRQAVLEKLRLQANCLDVSPASESNPAPVLSGHRQTFSTGSSAL